MNSKTIYNVYSRWVSLQPDAKAVVNVDTTSLALSYAKLTDAPQDSLNTIKGRVAANITDVIKPMIAARIQRNRIVRLNKSIK